jgi:Tfp pilus assembly pilus retraction ATPase PilT
MEAAAAPTRNYDFAEVLTRMAADSASDVHLSPGFCPAIRVRGKIVALRSTRR